MQTQFIRWTHTMTAVLLLVFLAAAPSWAGLLLVATPNQASFDAGVGTGNMALSVDLDGMPSGSIQFVTGPALSAMPIGLSFVPRLGASGPSPTITGTSTNAAAGWNPVIAPTATTFTAFNFTPEALPPGAIVGQLDFTIPDHTTTGMFDLVATEFALDGVDFPTQAIGTVNIVPEPSSFVLLGSALLLFQRRWHTARSRRPHRGC